MGKVQDQALSYRVFGNKTSEENKAIEKGEETEDSSENAPMKKALPRRTLLAGSPSKESRTADSRN